MLSIATCRTGFRNVKNIFADQNVTICIFYVSRTVVTAIDYCGGGIINIQEIMGMSCLTPEISAIGMNIL